MYIVEVFEYGNKNDKKLAEEKFKTAQEASERVFTIIKEFTKTHKYLKVQVSNNYIAPVSYYIRTD